MEGALRKNQVELFDDLVITLPAESKLNLLRLQLSAIKSGNRNLFIHILCVVLSLLGVGIINRYDILAENILKTGDRELFDHILSMGLGLINKWRIEIRK
jgi:hypothetical protein